MSSSLHSSRRKLSARCEKLIHADAIFGSPNVIALVSGPDIAGMDAVIDRIAEVSDVAATDSKVARWIDNVEFPLS
jgi:hypothetical protein